MEKSNNLSFFKNLLTLTLLSALFSLSSCTEDTEDDGFVVPKNIRVLVSNEGQFGKGTASISALTHDNLVVNDLFRNVNNRPIGDVAQSITEIGDNYYVPLNNSQKVEVFNKTTFLSTETIPVDCTPTFVVDLGDERIAVSGLSGDYLSLVSLKGTSREVKKIADIGSTSQMKVKNNKLFLAGSTFRVVDINNINATTMRTILALEDEKEESEETPEIIDLTISVVNGSKIIEDKNGNLWVLSADKLYCINPQTETVTKQFPFEKGVEINMWSGRIEISPSGETLYFTGKVNDEMGVMKMSIRDTKTPTQLLFSTSEVRDLYGLGVSNEETIFIADVKFGSLARGIIHEFSNTGELLRKSEVGIFPSFFHFLK